MKLATVILIAFLISACSGRTVRGGSSGEAESTRPPASTANGSDLTHATSASSVPGRESADQPSAGDAPGERDEAELDEELADLNQILSDLDRAMTELSDEYASNEGETTP